MIIIFFVSKLMDGFPFIEYLCNLNNSKNVFFFLPIFRILRVLSDRIPSMIQIETK